MSSQNDTNASIFFNCTQARHKPATNRQTNQTKVTKLTTTTTKQCQHKAHNASTICIAKYAVKKNNNASPLKIITKVYSNLPAQPALTVCSDFPVSRFLGIKRGTRLTGSSVSFYLISSCRSLFI